ncbi:MAG: glycoside hydrolase family 38 C-terminal domain-containing protein [Pseudomonadota bacterium]
MIHKQRFTVEKIDQRIRLGRANQIRQSHPIDRFRFRALPDAATEPPLTCDTSSWQTLDWESYWGGNDVNFVLRSAFLIPKGWAKEVWLHLPLGEAGDIFTHPEALLYIDGQPIASADRYHHMIPLDPALIDGRRHQIALHGWTGLSGWPPDPKDRTKLFMRTCAIVERDAPTVDFLNRAEVALDVARYLPEARPERSRILSALDRAFLTLDTRDPIGGWFWGSVPRALAVLEEELVRAGAPMDATLQGVGHAHMDIGYLWPVMQSRRKNARTYSNVLRLMERFPDYHFSQSQPQLYSYTERDYPEIFQRIKERVAEGRWEIMGGMWVEPDANISGPEALVRQIMLGRRYFRDRFGDVETPVLWLPDTFGFCWSLPQLMKQADLKWFVTNKVNWNQYNKMPASTTWWQGIDGTKVLTHFLTTPRDVQYLPFPTNYKSDLSAPEVFGTYENTTLKAAVPYVPISYGYGDGGGGPTEELIEKARIYSSMPGAPQIRMGPVRTFFETLEERQPDLPTWNGEIYLEGHRGVLTSQAWLKRANRKSEVLLRLVEFVESHARMLGNEIDTRADMTKAWELLCLNQFHDILSGTAVTKVFDDARNDFRQIQEIGENRLRSTVQSLAPQLPANTSAVALNSLPFARSRIGFLASAQSRDYRHVDGRGITSQVVAGGRLVEFPDMPPLSAIPLAPADAAVEAEPDPKAVSARVDTSGPVLENAYLRVSFASNGEIAQILDKRQGRQVLRPGVNGNRLQAFEDRPISWDAWDIDAFFEDRGEIVSGLVSMEIVETGPLRAAVRIERHYRQSRITQTVTLMRRSARVDFRTHVDWHESHLLLKAAFAVNVLSPLATFEIQWGNLQRPTHRNTSWDYARFEVPAQSWADLSEGDYGVALLNDCKYGYDVRDDVLRLSLIKSATMPDPEADQGEHIFTYSLFPHPGDWRHGVIEEAYDLNHELRVIPVSGSGIDVAETEVPFVSTPDPGVVIQTLKPAEDGDDIIIRLFEAHRCRRTATVRFGVAPARVSYCNLLEEPDEDIPLDGKSISIALKPYEIVSLRVTVKQA